MIPVGAATRAAVVAVGIAAAVAGAAAPAAADEVADPGVGGAAASGDAGDAADDGDGAAWPATATVDLQLFGGFTQRHTATEDDGAFELGRGELGVRAPLGPRAGAELRLESLRSASPQSLFGIDGDSLVIRVKRAWGFVTAETGPVRLEARLGLVPDPWVEALETGYPLRPVSPTLAERGGFFDTSDAGATAIARYRDLATVSVSVLNGEGRHQIEQNAGKNTTAVVAVSPWRGCLGVLGPARLRVQLAARDGSVGAGSASDRRLAAAVTLAGDDVGVGAEAVQAFGFAGQGGVDARGAGAWATAALWRRWLGGWVRYDRFDPDVDTGGDARWVLSAGVWSEPSASRRGALRVFAGVEHEGAGAGAGPFPGATEAAEATRVLILMSADSSWGLP